MPKLKELRIAKGRQQKELGKAIGTDEPMMSRFENYKCLPIPPMMNALLKELDCKIEDIYEPHEVYSQMTVAPTKKRKRKSGVYRLTAELPEEAKEFLNSGALQKLGFKDITAWVNYCYEQVKKHYEVMTAKEKDSTNRHHAEQVKSSSKGTICTL